LESAVSRPDIGSRGALKTAAKPLTRRSGWATRELIEAAVDRSGLPWIKSGPLARSNDLPTPRRARRSARKMGGEKLPVQTPLGGGLGVGVRLRQGLDSTPI
jgi:hypothetical protein